jgi:quinol monooxygenase YgiN
MDDSHTDDRPVTAAYFYRVRWGHHDEWLDLFRRNHWPLLREEMRTGRMLDVRLYQPRFHGDGRADWDVLVTITYRDWAAMEAHTARAAIERLFPDQEGYRAQEQRRFELLDAHWDVPLEALDLPER